MRFSGTTSTPTIVGVDQLPSVINYFTNDDSSKWQTNVPTYAGVVYQQLYSGIDVRYDGHNGLTKSTFSVAAGANPAQIRWSYTGTKQIRVDDAGNLVLALAPPSGRQIEDRILVEQKPVAWQDINGQRVPVAAAYTLASDRSVGFSIGQYDSSYPLTIDPILTFGSYLGGTSTDEALDIAVDSSGTIYLVGFTVSTNFPTIAGYQGAPQSFLDGFVSKIQSGTLVYSTYFGGADNDQASGVAIDSSGKIYVTGFTASTNFPTKNAYDTSANGSDDGFVAKFDPIAAGTASLLYSSYIGGSGDDNGTSIALSGTKAYITGTTDSANFPKKNAYDSTVNGGLDAFVMRLDPSVSGTSSLLYGTYLGGSNDDLGQSITVDSSGKAYITGYTLSTNFPTKNAYDTIANGGEDGFVAKLDPSVSGSSSFKYSTYFGGSNIDRGEDIGVDSTGKAYIVGYTYSTNLPTKNAYDGTANGDADVYMAEFDAAISGANSFVYGTYLGGSGVDTGDGIAVESNGYVSLIGTTQSTNFPLGTAFPMQTSLNGTQDAFVTKLDPQAPPTQQVRHMSAYLGGSNWEYGADIAVDSSGRLYVAGFTFSNDFPVTSNATQSTFQGSTDAFVVKVFPEVDQFSACRWPHTTGVITNLTYTWGSGFQTTGTQVRNDMAAAIANWNTQPVLIRFAQSSTGSITLDAYSFNDGTYGGTSLGCSGASTISALVRINTFENRPSYLRTEAHELGHSMSIGHIFSNTGALMNYNSATTTPVAIDRELINLVYP